MRGVGIKLDDRIRRIRCSLAMTYDTRPNPEPDNAMHTVSVRVQGALPGLCLLIQLRPDHWHGFYAWVKGRMHTGMLTVFLSLSGSRSMPLLSPATGRGNMRLLALLGATWAAT